MAHTPHLNLVLYCNLQNVWKLTDFGFTSEALSTAKTTLNQRGTPGYHAPALFDSEKPQFSNRSDIWALRCIIHELATGRAVFTNDFETYQYALGSIEIHLDVSRNSQFWHHHVSETICDMLSREAHPRPDAKQLSQRMSVYATILGIPNPAILTQASVFMPYQPWNTLVDVSGPQMELFFRLSRWYYGNGQYDVQLSLISNILKDRSEVQSWDSLTCKVEAVPIVKRFGVATRICGVRLDRHYMRTENPEKLLSSTKN